MGTSLLFRLVLLGVPRHLRDSVHGDLLEQRGGVRDALAIAWHFQAEPWRDSGSRRAALLLLVAAAGLLWLVPLAAATLLAQAGVFSDGFSRAALQLWSAPTVVAAVACGLLLGRASLLPRHADAARLHLVLLLLPVAAWAAPAVLQALLAAVLLPAAAWLAHQNGQPANDGAEATR
jgi:hypothetical protein